MPGSSERVTDDVCGLARRWVVGVAVAQMLVSTESKLQKIFSAEGLRWPGLTIISGYRSQDLQMQVNPANPDSNHTKCPAMAVDLRVGDVAASLTPPALWGIVGQVWKAHGGRWGGDFPKPDNNHFELPTAGF